MKMLIGLLAVLTLTFAQIVWAGDFADVDIYQSASTSSVTERATVQRKAQLRVLTATEQKAIDVYMQKRTKLPHGCPNERSLRASLEFLVAIDQSHVPLTRNPDDYWSDYQTFTQIYNRTDWYVNIQSQKIFIPPLGELGPIRQTARLCLETLPECQPVPQCAKPEPAPVCQQPQQPCEQIIVIGGGTAEQRPFTLQGATTVGYAGFGFGFIRKGLTVTPIPTPTTCPPNGGTGAQPPVGTTNHVGNPSNQNVGGDTLPPAVNPGLNGTLPPYPSNGNYAGQPQTPPTN